MKTLKFILEKIVIVEVMLILLYFATNLFNVSIPIVDTILTFSLTYLTPVAVISLIGYIILSLLSFKVIEIILAIIFSAILLYYISNR